MKTMAEKEGWTAYERVKKRRRTDTRRRLKCGMNCGWNDHTTSTKNLCPLHKDYVGHLKAGGKPKGMRGDTAAAEEWKIKQQEELEKRGRAARTPGAFECRHNMCKECYKRSLKADSLKCPYCRTDMANDLKINKECADALHAVFPGYDT